MKGRQRRQTALGLWTHGRTQWCILWFSFCLMYPDLKVKQLVTWSHHVADKVSAPREVLSSAKGVGKRQLGKTGNYRQ